MKLLLSILVFLFLPSYVFSATPHVYSCQVEPDSYVSVSFSMSSPAENMVQISTSHESREQYVYSYPIKVFMKAKADSSGVAWLQLASSRPVLHVSGLHCAPDDSSYRIMYALAGIVSAGLIFYGILDAL